MECIAHVKCSKGSHCATRELIVDVSESKVRFVVAKSGRKFSEVTNFKTSIDGRIKISGRDSFGETFSAKLDLKKIGEYENYSILGTYNLFRVYPVNLACKKIKINLE